MDVRDAIAMYCDHYSQRGVGLEYPEELVVDRGVYWYLPDPRPFIGRRGMIIRKEDGAISVIDSGLTRERAFWAYERGILEGRHDLIITSCLPDLDATIDILTKTPPSQRGKKLPGPGRLGWYRRLSSLPAVVFANADLFPYIDELMEAEQKGIFSFETRPPSKIAEPAAAPNSGSARPSGNSGVKEGPPSVS
jgi:hypothetical protein